MAEPAEKRLIEIRCNHHIDLYVSPDCPPIRIVAVPDGDMINDPIPGKPSGGGGIRIQVEGRQAFSQMIPTSSQVSEVLAPLMDDDPCRFIVVHDPDLVSGTKPDDV